MPDYRNAKKTFYSKGQINENFVGKELALSWQKSKLQGLNINDKPKTSGILFEFEKAEIFDFCDRIIPEHISYYITLNSGEVLHSRVNEVLFHQLDNLSDKYIGTTSFSLSLLSGVDSKVELEQHYLDSFTFYTSRTVVVNNGEYYITLFFSGLENEYVYLSTKNSLLSFTKKSSSNLTSVKKNIAVISDYLDGDKYFLDELLNKKIEQEVHIPTLVIGEDADALAWYYADKQSLPSLRISHKGIPEDILEEKLVEYSNKSKILIIGDFDEAPPKFVKLVVQVVDFMIKNPANKKKQIIVTTKEKPLDDALTSRLALSTIDLNDFLKEKKPSFEYKTISEMEEELIKNTLVATNWNATLAAQKLGIGRATLYRKMKLYHFENERGFSK